jgi:hypothetical protein
MGRDHRGGWCLMADRYVYSGAAGTGSGADWANAHTTLAAAITASTAGDRFFVAHDHAESTAALLTLTFKGTAASPDTVLCVNRAGSVPPVAADLRATATVTTTGANAITMGGVAYVEGIIFNCGTGASAANLTIATISTYRNCAFNIVNTSNSSQLTSTSNVGALTYWYDCTVSFGATGQVIVPMGGFHWIGPAGSAGITGATIPTSLFNMAGSHVADLQVYGVDLSALGSGKTLTAAANRYKGAAFTNCKLDSAVTISGTHTAYSTSTDLISCHSTTNAVRFERYRYQGTLTTETTIVRSGGATAGGVPYSWKIVPTANNERNFPFRTFEGAVANTTTGSSKTLTVHTVTDGVTLTDAEIWLEVEYLGTAGTPVSTLITDAAATILTTAANQTTSTETWTTTGLASPTKQQLSVTFTPQLQGLIRWRVCYAKTSTTVYVCPDAELS